MMKRDIKTNRLFRINEAGGLRIKNLNYIFIIVILISSAILFGLSLSLSKEYNEGTQITDEYNRMEQDAMNVRFASDYLTKSVQLFVVTGEKVYLNDYFEEVNVAKRREKAIADLKEMENTGNILGSLEKSVNESMNLTKLEYQAMRYAAEGYGYDISELYEEIRTADLPAKASDMTDKEKIREASEIVFGTEYYEYKSRIYNYETKFVKDAEALMEELQDEGRRQMHVLIVLQIIMICIIAFLGVVLFLTIAKLVVAPLKNAVHSISEGATIDPITGTFEIKYMSNTYNGYHRTSVELQKQLKNEAERDALTGVLNRRGYHTVIDRLAIETFPMAMLILDVDNFKSINDDYGHSAGDEVLQRIGHILMDVFRDTDITSRIGGDEFAVIMSDITPKGKGAIADKVDLINRKLQNPEDESLPKATMSAGCFFSSSGYTDHMFSEADKMMYKAKKSGGGKVCFEQ